MYPDLKIMDCCPIKYDLLNGNHYKHRAGKLDTF